MNTLRKQLTAIGLAGTVGLGALAISPTPSISAPVAPAQNGVKNAVPDNKTDVQRRWRRGRGYGPAIALGVFGAAAGAIAADRYYRRNYYGDPYNRAYYAPPAYGYGYGPRYRYYGW